MHIWVSRVSSAPLFGCAAGAALAVTYTLSPLTVWFTAAMVLIFGFLGRGLSGRERRWALGLLSLGLGLRLLALAGFFLFTMDADGSLAVMLPDEAYIARRSLWLRNIALGIPIATNDFVDAFNPFAESAILYVLAYVQLLVGTAPYGIRLLSVALSLAATVIFYKTVRPTFGAPASLIGLSAALFMPSAFVWSISTLKEPPYYFLSAVSLACVVTAVRSRSKEVRIAAAVTGLAAVVVLGTVREASAIVVGAGMVMGGMLTPLLRRPAFAAAALAIVLTAGTVAFTHSAVRQRGLRALQTAAVMHVGHVKTPGRAYKLLDPQFYTRLDQRDLNYGAAIRVMQSDALARYVIRAALSFVLVPLPWQVSSWSAAAYLPQQVLWAVMVVFALVGVVAGLRRDGLLTLILASTVLIAAAGVTLTSGNIGTFVRHRDMTLLYLVWLSGVGFWFAVQSVAARYTVRERLGGAGASTETCAS